MPRNKSGANLENFDEIEEADELDTAFDLIASSLTEIRLMQSWGQVGQSPPLHLPQSWSGTRISSLD